MLSFPAVLLLCAYVFAQLWRDVQRRDRGMAAWGLLMAAFMVWVLCLMFGDPIY